MFYILATRLPLVYTDDTKRKYLKLFILGSIIYLAVHYYLFLEDRSGLLNKVKSKIYYIMVADFTVACLLVKFLTHRKIEEEPDDEPSPRGFGQAGLQSSEPSPRGFGQASLQPGEPSPRGFGQAGLQSSEPVKHSDKSKLGNENDRTLREIEEKRRLMREAFERQQMLERMQQQMLKQKEAEKEPNEENINQDNNNETKKNSKKNKKKETTTSSSSSSSSSSSKLSEKEERRDDDKKVDNDTELPIYE